jgi:hypothetical protein
VEHFVGVAAVSGFGSWLKDIKWVTGEKPISKE